MSNPTLSIVVIARNEAQNLAQSLPTWRFADEIIVVIDAATTDQSAQIARQAGAKVIERAWQGFADQKNFAISQASSDWILALDADEQPTPKAQEQIRTAIATAQFDSYYLPWQTFFLGRAIRHSGWYPEWQLRLFRRGSTAFKITEVHEKIAPTDRTGYLPNAIVHHYSYPTLKSYFTKLASYTSLEAKEKRKKLTLTNWVKMLIKPLYQFISMYIIKLGFLDGWAGLVLALFSTYYCLVVLIKSLYLRLGGQL